MRLAISALAVVTNHELPEKLVERLMIESVLRRGDAEGDVIHAREGPSVASVAGKKSNDGRRVVCFWQRSAITESDFHLGRRKLTGQLFRNAAACSVRRDEHGRTPFVSAHPTQHPIVFFTRTLTKRDALIENVRSGFTRTLTQVRIKCRA